MLAWKGLVFKIYVPSQSQDMEASQVPIHRALGKKLWYMYTTEYSSAIEKN